MQGLYRTEAYYPNTTIKQLKQPSWQLLLSRIGDSLMLHLLMHVTIFVPLPNGCYLQVTGLPAAQVMFAPGFLLLKQDFASGMTLQHKICKQVFHKQDWSLHLLVIAQCKCELHILKTHATNTSA